MLPCFLKICDYVQRVAEDKTEIALHPKQASTKGLQLEETISSSLKKHM